MGPPVGSITMKALIFTLMLIPTLAQAIPEKGFRRIWLEEALPFYHSLNKGSFVNEQGLTIRYSYKTDPSNNKALIILPGRIEPAMKYAELLYDFKDRGYDLFIMDHQGQGESDRLLEGTDKGHVLNFDDYVQDFSAFVEIVQQKTNNPLYLISHSMGGAISAFYLDQNPGVFEKAALMAPMLQINTAPYGERLALSIVNLLTRMGRSTSYAPGYGPYRPAIDQHKLSPVTHSYNRWWAAKYISLSRPDVVTGGPTVKWVQQSIRATKKIPKLQVKTPVILFQAQWDFLVRPGRQKNFCKEDFCRLIYVPGAKHEILQEKDVIRDNALNEIELFFGS
jgi:lysophospholipase